MINRFSLAALSAAFALSGCAQHSVDETVGDFSSGATQLTVTHLDTRAADGTALFVTVDGQDAGALPLGEKVELNVPAGKHQIGGYARSLIGRVTISPIEVTTSDEAIKNIAYSVTKSKPVFTVLTDTPKPKPAPVEAPTPEQAPPVTADANATAAPATSTQTAETQATDTQETDTQATETQATETQATPAPAADSGATASQAVKPEAAESQESTSATSEPQS